MVDHAWRRAARPAAPRITMADPAQLAAPPSLERSIARRRTLVKALVGAKAAVDALAVTVSFALSFRTYHILGLTRETRGLELYLPLGLLAIAVVIVVFERLGLYRPQTSVLNIEEVRSTTRGVIVASLVFLALTFYFRDDTGHAVSRMVVTMAFGWLVLVANALRAIVHRVESRLHLSGIGTRNVLVLGTGANAQQLVRRLFGAPEMGLKPAGVIACAPGDVGQEIQGQTGSDSTRVRVLGTVADLASVASDRDVDEVLIALEPEQSGTLPEVFARCEALGLPVGFVPHLYGLPCHELSVDTLDGMPLIRRQAFRERPLHDLFKRVVDVLGAAVGLALGLPFFAILPALIRLDDRGPALFRQERVGLDGRRFTILKFRTMGVDTPMYEFHPKDRSDARLTRVGRWLRRLSLDELPQFVNVLRGEMSLVGPRPEMPFIVEKYGALERQRLRVKPGLTGLWQISDDRARMIHENMDYDLFYVYQRSPLLDLIIVLATMGKVLQGVGAR